MKTSYIKNDNLKRLITAFKKIFYAPICNIASTFYYTILYKKSALHCLFLR